MFDHLLVPLDGSQLAEKALPAALELSTRLQSQLTLLRIVQPPHIITPGRGAEFAELTVTLNQEAHHDAENYLQNQQETLRQQGYEAQIKVVEHEDVAEAIWETAESLHADLIVMCTHGLGGLKRWVYGSVADRVLRHAQIPILLIRAADNTINIALPSIENLDDIRSHDEP